jgi:hypothetical protein
VRFRVVWWIVFVFSAERWFTKYYLEQILLHYRTASGSDRILNSTTSKTAIKMN